MSLYCLIIIESLHCIRTNNDSNRHVKQGKTCEIKRDLFHLFPQPKKLNSPCLHRHPFPPFPMPDATFWHGAAPQPPAATRPNYGLITPRPRSLPNPPINQSYMPPAGPLSLVAIPDSRTRRQRRSRVLQPRIAPSVQAPTCCARYKKTTTTALQLPPLSQLQSTPRPASPMGGI